MGSITSINRRPNTWPVLDMNETLKRNGEPVLRVTYGSCDDYPDVCSLSTYMRESVYKKCLSGEYIVSPESSFKQTLILATKDGRKVQPEMEGVVY